MTDHPNPRIDAAAIVLEPLTSVDADEMFVLPAVRALEPSRAEPS